MGFDLPPGPEAQGVLPRSPGRLLLLGGVPDLRLVPRQKLARAYGNALRGARGRRLLDYGDARGNERLRQALCELLSRVRGIRVSPASICTVRGSQQGLYLAARVLLRPGDVVAVEALGYPPAWQAVRLAGAEPVPIEVDGDGIDVNALEALCHRTRVRAVVVTPHHQCPTTATLSPERRTALLALARRHRLAVIEDDYDYDFHYDGLPVLPLAARDDAGVVVYIGTLSKGFAPGLRLGYVAGPSPVIERIAGYRSFVDQQGDQLLEQAVATLLEDGDLQRHVRQTHRAYRARRDVLCQALNARLPALTFQRPAGGMAIWAHAAGIDVDRWVAQALVEGVAIQSGRQFRFDGGESAHVRIGFAACNEGELVEAVGRLASSWEAVAPPLR